jgi:hypothetical protein
VYHKSHTGYQGYRALFSSSENESTVTIFQKNENTVTEYVLTDANNHNRIPASSRMCLMNIRYLVVVFTLMLGNVIADDITESEPNNTLASAQNVDSHFITGANPDIANATTWPWVSINAAGDGSNDYYSFVVPVAGVTGIFDIDYGYHMGGSVDTELCLYAADGSVLADNDDFSPSTTGGRGSASFIDSYISHTFAAPGTYVIGVGKFNVFCNVSGITGTVLDADNDYELQISLSQHVIDTDRDGVQDDKDRQPNSDLSTTVMVESCESGVANTLFEDGCTIADLLGFCADDAKNHGSFTSCVAGVTRNLKKDGEIRDSDAGMLQRCAAQSGIGR